jgi:lipopolysaccharide export system protein LptC
LNSAKSPLRRRLILLSAALAVVAAALAGPQQPAALAICNAASVDYYSDATFTTVVGNCTHGCCQNWVCTGTLTQYSVVVYKETCQ